MKALKYTTSEKKLTLILEKYEKIEAKLTLGDFGIEKDEKQIAIFSDYSKRWIDITVPATCKESSARDYKGLLKNHIIPVFGNLKINEINRLMVKDLLMKKSKPLKLIISIAQLN